MDLTKLTITGPDGEVYRLVRVDAGDSIAEYRKMTPQEFSKYLAKRLNELDTSWRSLERAAGVAHATIVDMKKPKKVRINPATIRALLEGLFKLEQGMVQ